MKKPILVLQVMAIAVFLGLGTLELYASVAHKQKVRTLAANSKPRLKSVAKLVALVDSMPSVKTLQALELVKSKRISAIALDRLELVRPRIGSDIKQLVQVLDEIKLYTDATLLQAFRLILSRWVEGTNATEFHNDLIKRRPERTIERDKRTLYDDAIQKLLFINIALYECHPINPYPFSDLRRSSIGVITLDRLSSPGSLSETPDELLRTLIRNSRRRIKVTLIIENDRLGRERLFAG